MSHFTHQAPRTSRRQSHVFRKRTTAMLKLNMSSADHLFSSSLIVLKWYPPRRAVRSRSLEFDVLLFIHTCFSARLHGFCCSRIYQWQASNSCCDHSLLRVISLHMSGLISHLFECQWLLFCCSLLYSYPPNRVCLWQFGYICSQLVKAFIQTWSILPIKLKALFLFVFSNLDQRESFLLFWVVSLFFLLMYLISWISECHLQLQTFSDVGIFSNVKIQTFHCSVFASYFSNRMMKTNQTEWALKGPQPLPRQLTVSQLLLSHSDAVLAKTQPLGRGGGHNYS